MTTFLDAEILLSLKKSEALYNKVAELSQHIFYGDSLADRDSHMKELEFLLQGIKGTEAHLTIFNHKTFAPELKLAILNFGGRFPMAPCKNA